MRGVLGTDLPVALVELFGNGADRVAINAQRAALAAAIPNATVIPTTGLQTIGGATHYDGPAMWTQEGGTEMGIAGHATADGVLHGLVLDRGAPAPTSAKVAAGADVPGRFAAFHRDVAAGVFDVLTGAGRFASGVTQDCWPVLEASDGDDPTGRLTPLFHLVRSPSVTFAAPPAVTPTAGGGAAFAWAATAPSADSWPIWPGDVPLRRPRLSHEEDIAMLDQVGGQVVVIAPCP